jgi:tetratricopeptide (TPR) repeat protein
MAPDEVAPVEILLDEATYTYDREQRLRRTHHRVYRITRSTALSSDWAVAAAAWSPWFQERPRITATVTSPDGTVTELDPASFEESGLRGESSVMFDDTRLLRAPLPNLEVGAEVELTTALAEHETFFEGGSIGRFYFGFGVPVEEARLTVEAPADVALRYEVIDLDLEPVETLSDQVRTLTFEAADVAAQRDWEPSMTPSQLRGPHVRVGIGESWSRVAARYGERVDERIAATDVSALPFDLPSRGTSRDEAIAMIAAQIHEKIRYTGLELGFASIIPVTPSEVVTRGYGDCKDKSTLMVALLRAAGIEASVALVRSGYEPPVSPSLPSVHDFNHVVVYVPGRDDEPTRWIDATIPDQPVDYIPIPIQGRRALVADASSEGLVVVPELPASTNRYLETRVATMADWGAGQIIETTQGTGMFAIDQRLRWDDREPDTFAEGLRSYAEGLYRAADIEDVTITKSESTSEPVRLVFTAVEAQVFDTADSEAHAELSARVLFQSLPNGALSDDDEPREHPLYFPAPYGAEVRYDITIPSGFFVRQAPESMSSMLGPARFEKIVEPRDDRVEVTYRFDSGPRTWSPEQVEAFRRATKDLAITESISFTHEAARLMKRRDADAALRRYRELAEAHPKSAVHWARFASGLLDAGLGVAARRAALHAAEINPKAYIAQFYVGHTHAHDLLGRPYNRGFDRERAIEAYRTAKDLDPDRYAARNNLAVTLEHDDHGVMWAAGADLEAANVEYESLAEDFDTEDIPQFIRLNAIFMDDFDLLERLARKDPPSPERNSHLIAAIANNAGIDAALDEIGRLPPETDRTTTLSTAADVLIAGRKYELAAELMRRSSTALDTETRRKADRIATLEPYDRASLAGRFLATTVMAVDSREAWRRLLEAMLADDPVIGTADIEHEAAAAVESYHRDPEAVTNLRQIRDAYGPRYFPDYMAARADYAMEGPSDGPWRVEITHDDPDPDPTYLYVERRGGSMRIVAFQGWFPQLGAYALRRVEAGDLEGAERWLRWAETDLRGTGPEIGFRAATLFGTIPTGVGDTRARTQRARVEAALLMSGHSATAKTALEILDGPDRAAVLRDSDELERVIIAAHRKAGMASDIVGRAHALAAKRQSLDQRQWFAEILWDAGKRREARRRLALLQGENPASVTLARLRARVEAASGDYEEALAALRAPVSTGNMNAELLTAFAWASLFVEPSPDEALGLAELAARLQGNRECDSLATLAIHYALAGRTMDAIDVLRHLGQVDPDASGRALLAQAVLGERYVPAAWTRAAHDLIQPTEWNDSDDPFGAWMLARQRRSALR